MSKYFVNLFLYKQTWAWSVSDVGGARHLVSTQVALPASASKLDFFVQYPIYDLHLILEATGPGPELINDCAVFWFLCRASEFLTTSLQAQTLNTVDCTGFSCCSDVSFHRSFIKLIFHSAVFLLVVYFSLQLWCNHSPTQGSVFVLLFFSSA